VHLERIAQRLTGEAYIADTDMSVRRLGSRGPALPIFALGGQAAVEVGTEKQAEAVLETAFENGVRYFDTAASYGPSQERLGKFFAGIDEDVFVATKSVERNKSTFLMEAENSNELLGRRPDVLHIHSVLRGEAPEILAKDGALEGALEAKAQGLCNHIGLTSHDDPDAVCEIIRRSDEIDVVMVALSAGDTRFLREMVPLCERKGIGVVAMKVMGRGILIRPDGPGVRTAEEAMRFPLSCRGVNLAVVGCSYPEEVEELTNVCEDFEPLEAAEMRDLVDGTALYEQDLMFYRGLNKWKQAPDMRPSLDWYYDE